MNRNLLNDCIIYKFKIIKVGKVSFVLFTWCIRYYWSRPWKLQVDFCEQCRSRSACVSAQPDQYIHFSNITYTSLLQSSHWLRRPDGKLTSWYHRHYSQMSTCTFSYGLAQGLLTRYLHFGSPFRREFAMEYQHVHLVRRHLCFVDEWLDRILCIQVDCSLNMAAIVFIRVSAVYDCHVINGFVESALQHVRHLKW